MVRAWALLGIGLSACASVLPARLVDRPVRARPCRVQAGRLSCANGERPLAELGVALPLRAQAPRLLGGLWLVDGVGLLHRVNARGAVTGVAADEVIDVVTSGRFVCFRSARGGVSCAVDRHDETGCSAQDVLSPFVPLEQGFRSLSAGAPGHVCGDLGTGQRCLRLAQPCQTACLRFPTCHAALRCVDACRPGQAELIAHPIDVVVDRAAAFIITAGSGDS